MKVKKKQLSGKIADFPLHLVQRMVDEQVKQGNIADPRVFAYMPSANKVEDGFDWDKTDEGDKFWSNVIRFKCFHLIPKPEKPKGHAHAKAMRQYAKDAKNSKTPWELWELWEFRVKNEKKWRALDRHPLWEETTQYRRKRNNQAKPTPDKKEQPKPNEIIRAMLDKGMEVWASVSEDSYDKARNNIGHCICQIVGYDETAEYPMQTKSLAWTFAVPIDWATMTEITELP